MTTINSKVTVSFQATLTLDESAARALNAMAGYGVDQLLQVHYMQPHEAGFRSLLEKVRSEIPAQLHVIDKAREALEALDANVGG